MPAELAPDMRASGVHDQHGGVVSLDHEYDVVAVLEKRGHTGLQLVDALKRAYAAAAEIRWPSRILRRDIGRRVLAASSESRVPG